MSVPIFEHSPENFRCMAIKIAWAPEEMSFLYFNYLHEADRKKISIPLLETKAMKCHSLCQWYLIVMQKHLFDKKPGHPSQ